MLNSEEKLTLEIPKIDKNIYKFILGKSDFRNYGRDNLEKFFKAIRRHCDFPLRVQVSDCNRTVQAEILSVSIDDSKYKIPECGIVAIVRDSQGEIYACGLYSFTTVKDENMELDFLDFYRYWWNVVSDDYYEE